MKAKHIKLRSMRVEALEDRTVPTAGFRSIGVPYTWRARKHGFSQNRLSQLVGGQTT